MGATEFFYLDSRYLDYNCILTLSVLYHLD